MADRAGRIGPAPVAERTVHRRGVVLDGDAGRGPWRPGADRERRIERASLARRWRSPVLLPGWGADRARPRWVGVVGPRSRRALAAARLGARAGVVARRSGDRLYRCPGRGLRGAGAGWTIAPGRAGPRDLARLATGAAVSAMQSEGRHGARDQCHGCRVFQGRRSTGQYEQGVVWMPPISRSRAATRVGAERRRHPVAQARACRARGSLRGVRVLLQRPVLHRRYGDGRRLRSEHGQARSDDHDFVPVPL